MLRRQRIEFVWGGCQLFRLASMQEDTHGLLKVSELGSLMGSPAMFSPVQPSPIASTRYVATTELGCFGVLLHSLVTRLWGC